jgi:hypothetical protein
VSSGDETSESVSNRHPTPDDTNAQLPLGTALAEGGQPA